MRYFAKIPKLQFLRKVLCKLQCSVDLQNNFGIFRLKYLSDGFVRGFLPIISSRFMRNLHVFKELFQFLSKAHTKCLGCRTGHRLGVGTQTFVILTQKCARIAYIGTVFLKVRWDKRQCSRTLFSLHTEAWELTFCHVRVCTHPQACLFTQPLRI